MVGEFGDDSGFVQARQNRTDIRRNFESVNWIGSEIKTHGTIKDPGSEAVLGSLIATEDFWLHSLGGSGVGWDPGFFGVWRNGDQVSAGSFLGNGYTNPTVFGIDKVSNLKLSAGFGFMGPIFCASGS